jgi:hypothetical protein
VARLALPELNLSHRPRVRARLERLLRVELEHVLDLLRPRHHRRLEHVHALLVLGRAVRRRQLERRQRQQRLTLGVANGDIDGGDEAVVKLHHVLHDHLGQPLLVVVVGQQRQVHLGRCLEEVLHHLRLQVAVDDDLLGVIGGDGHLLRLQEIDDLLFLVGRRRLEASQLLCALGDTDTRHLRVEKEIEHRPAGLLEHHQLLKFVRLDV